MVNLYRQAEEYFFGGILLKNLKLAVFARAYLTEEAYLKTIFILEKMMIDVTVDSDEIINCNSLHFPEELCVTKKIRVSVYEKIGTAA